MKKEKPTVFNLIDSSDKTVTVLLGFSKYICGGFRRNNIQMTGDWYLDYIDERVEEIVKVIDVLTPNEVNFVGTSKSNTGSFIFASKLSVLFPEITFKIFAFSAYTKLDKNFFEDNGLVDVAPPSLVKIWENNIDNKKALIHADALELIDKTNIEAYLLYPAPSRGAEPVMAQRMQVLSNVTTVPLNVRVHGILFPFWKPLLPGLKLEVFEGQVMELRKDVYAYFEGMQNDKSYKFDLYSIVFDTQKFVEEMARFDKEWSVKAYR
ncbi:hypothetical protein ACT3RU_14750 [Halomonas sp. TP35]